MARGIFTPGNDASATELNDAFDPPRFRVRWAGAAQSIPNNTTTALTFDTEDEDVGGCHDNAVNNSRGTVPAGGAGWWNMMAGCEVAANATGRRELAIRINGTTFVCSDRDTVGHATVATRLLVCTEYRLAVGDYFEAVFFQNSGGALTISVAPSFSPWMSGRWLHP